MQKLPELLSPAGSFDAGVAAFAYGADAVYLGLNRFSARADAANFSIEELERLLAYARTFERPRKIYVTLNTLTESHERAELLPLLGSLEDLGIDGAIIHDLGVASLMKRHFPRIPRHASTQLACTSTDGARALKALGFERVVTARELGLEEADAIGKNAGVEIEVFAHGALCYSVSGLCLYSSMTTGRSGNRGRCAYCCRQAFTNAQGVASHPYSMRDLASVDAMETLRHSTLASLKIEGRMKNALYVAAVTDFYRDLLDGVLTPQGIAAKAENLQTIFSRPWTPLYTLSSKTTPAEIIDALCIGHRGAPIGKVRKVTRDIDGNRWLAFETQRALEKHDGIQIDLPRGGRPIGFAVTQMRDFNTRRPAITLPAGTRLELALPPETAEIPAGSLVYCSASQAVRRSFPVPHPRSTETRMLQPAELTLTLSEEGFTLEGCGQTVTTQQPLDMAKHPEATANAAERALSRLGEDGFFLRKLTVVDPQERFLPVSSLNQARRDWAAQVREALDGERAKRRTKVALLPEAAPLPETNAPTQWTVKVAAIQSPSVLEGEMPERVVVLLSADTTLASLRPWIEAVPREQLRWALPVALRDTQVGPMASLVGELSDRGFRAFEVADLAGWQLLQDVQPYCDAYDITADWSWYAINPEAVAVQESLGVRGAVTGPEANLPNLLTLPNATTREVLVAQYTPLFMAFTKPLTDATELTDRNGLAVRVTQLGSLWVTFAEAPWSTPLAPLERSGLRSLRVDLSWAGAALPITHWREILKQASPYQDHFSMPRM